MRRFRHQVLMGEIQSIQRAKQLCSTERERELLQRNPLLPQYGMQRELNVVRNLWIPVFGKRPLYGKILSEAPALQSVIGNDLHQCAKRAPGRFLSVHSIVKYCFSQNTLQSINRFVGHRERIL